MAEPKAALSEDEALKVAQRMREAELKRELGGVQQTRSIQAPAMDNYRLHGGKSRGRHAGMLARHGMTIFGCSVVFMLSSIYYFSGMTVEAKYGEGKRICVSCADQKEAAQRRWFSPPTIPEPPDLPDALKKTRMLP
jgi:hypothetical protein